MLWGLVIGSHYLQVQGMAMGINCAPANTNLSDDALTIYLYYALCLYLLFIRTASVQEVTFLTILNNNSYNLKFTLNKNNKHIITRFTDI